VQTRILKSCLTGPATHDADRISVGCYLHGTHVAAWRCGTIGGCKWAKGGGGPLFRRLGMSDDYIPERDAAQAARWAVKWRDLAEEALAVADATSDPEARRHMLFIAEAYKLLAERAKERSVRLVCGLA
jgi:hypothetical protein